MNVLNLSKCQEEKQKFSAAWLDAKGGNGHLISEWCKKGKDEYHGYCKFCQIDIKCDNTGKIQLSKHSEKQKHKEVMKYLKDRSQAKLTTFTATKVEEASCSTSQPHAIELFTVSDASLKAEVYSLGKLAVSNYSLCSSDHFGDLFQAVFPDSRIAENFTLSHISASYIIGQELAPYFT